MTRARLGALAVLAVSLVLPLAAMALSGQTAGELDARHALVFDVPGVSLEELLSIPEVAALARSGGAALLANPDEVVFDLPAPDLDPRHSRPVGVLRIDPDSPQGIGGVGRSVRSYVELFPAEELMVIVFSSGPSPAMIEVKDELPGVVMAVGAFGELFDPIGVAGSLTSDSTRRPGVVVGGDIPETVDAFLGGVLVPGPRPAGAPIEVADGPPPFALHERYLAQRRLYVPVGTAAALYLTAAGLGGVGLLAAGRRAPRQWRRIAGWATLSVPMLAVGMLAAGHLPELSYAAAVPMVAIVTVLGTLAFSPLERRDLTFVPAGIGATILLCVAAEAVVGWSGMLTPLLGGTQLDGGRFFGLPNVAIGLVVGGGLWVAQRLPTAKGFALLCVVALFAGLPFAGANLGGAVTGFFAAGTWVAVRERSRLGAWRGLAVVAATTAVGSAIVLLAHAISPIATHVTNFEREVEGLAGLLEEFVDRLQVGFDLIAGSPAAIVPVLGLPVSLFVVLRPPPVISTTFDRWPAWRDAVLVTILAGIVGYVVNDSGPAAAGLAFGMGLGGMLGVSLLARPGKMEPS